MKILKRIEDREMKYLSVSVLERFEVKGQIIFSRRMTLKKRIFRAKIKKIENVKQNAKEVSLVEFVKGSYKKQSPWSNSLFHRFFRFSNSKSIIRMSNTIRRTRIANYTLLQSHSRLPKQI